MTVCRLPGGRQRGEAMECIKCHREHRGDSYFCDRCRESSTYRKTYCMGCDVTLLTNWSEPAPITCGKEPCAKHALAVAMYRIPSQPVTSVVSFEQHS